MKQRLLSLWRSLPPRKRKWAAWTTGLLLFYTLFGFCILPLIVKAVAAKQLTKLLDRETTIRQVRINPYVLSGTIRGLLIKDKDGEPFVSFEEAYGNFQLISFFGKPWVFKDVWTIKPYVRARINPDYSFNFSDLLKKLSEAMPPPTAPRKPLYLHVGRLKIDGATASFTDLTIPKPFHRLIGPVQITLTDFHTDPNDLSPYNFSGTTDSGERFWWSGSISVDPLQSAGELSLQGMSLSRYAPMFQDAVRFDIKDGVVEGRAAYRIVVTGSNYVASLTNASGSLQSLKIAERGGSENIIELDSAAIAGLAVDTGAETAEIQRVSVAGGRLSAKRNADQTINLLQLAEPSPGTTKAPGAILFLMKAVTNAVAALVQSTNLWSATIHELDVTNCSVQWEDQATPTPVHVKVDEIAVSARHLSNVRGSNQTASVSLRLNTNGVVKVDSSIQIAPPSADVGVNLSDVEMAPFGSYVQPFLNLQLINSKLGISGQLQLRTTSNAVPDVTFRGDARVDDFATLDSDTDELLKWDSVQISSIDATLQPLAAAVKQVSIVSPFARVAFDKNQTLNFLKVLKPASTNAEPTAAAPNSPSTQKKAGLRQKLGDILQNALKGTTNSAGASALPKVTVEAISFTNGMVQFVDRSVQPEVSTSIQDLSGRILDISSEELKRADIYVMGSAGKNGPIEIIGKVNPLHQDAPTDVSVKFTNIDLSPGSPYAGKFLGYRLSRGRLGLQTDLQVAQRQLKSKNLITLDQLTLGEKVESPDATKLPVKLGIALLKDRNGKIEIDLPVEGDLNDPQFRFGKVAMHVLANMMTKIVTSPFAALGAVFGGKGEDISYQDFGPGSSSLSAANAQKLDHLITGLYERPGLELQIEGSFDPNADADALRKQKLERRFREQKWAALGKSEQARISADEVPLSHEEYFSRVQAAYNTLARSTVTNSPGRSSGTEAASATTSAPPKSADDKGAAGLLQKTAVQPTVAADDKEQLVLASISITEQDLFHLASERARTVRQHILDSGKIDAGRLTFIDTATTTNRAARVFFQLQ